eukprot:3105103-Rhodomonas_salina.1
MHPTHSQSHSQRPASHAVRRLAELALEELNYPRREVELAGLLNQLLGRHLIGNHELREVTDDLGGGRDLDDVAEDV